MAVQAQYPPNILLLNRNGQEGNDYSLPQPQSKVELLDQSQTLYNNENGNSRKRGRETVVANTSNNIINQSFSMQPHPPKFIELSQLHNQHQNVVSTGLGLCFGDQQKQRLQLHQQHHRCHSSSSLSLLSQGFSSQMKQRTDEFDIFLHAQGDELVRTLAEKMQRHYQELLRKAEEAVARRLREKEAEADKAMRRNAELEARAAQLSAEAQVWQAKAMTQEAAAASLQAQLQQAMTAAGCRGGDDGGAGLSFAMDGGQAEDAESGYIDPDRVEVVASVVARAKCKGCGKRVVSVVVLPCRHLCICAECDSLLRACPVCLTLKNSTVEVYLS
ncbi:hypothetical protein Lal_00015865 [Lupinus albus]|uniref:Putative transcription factor C2H2 family n=1 Tax=Lupinus albus TaxID=3870 RepID=A0A6A4QJA2_LUPAL|nr:putative transcription factor C2H2 family [Lupinus albus]KAF1872777.1 hypothetical protein Lal_00015865 [Lupinus albus]